ETTLRSRSTRSGRAHVDPLGAAELRAVLAAAPPWMAGRRPRGGDRPRPTHLDRQRLGPTKTRGERRVAFGHQIVEDTLEWRPRADVIDAMVTKIRRLKRAPLDPTGFLFTQLDGRAWTSIAGECGLAPGAGEGGVRYRPAEQLRHTVASTLPS